MNRRTSLLGVVFIILGGLFLSAKYLFGENFINLGPEDFWPMIVLLIGLVFEMVYYVSLRAPGFLVPGGILTTCGLLFFFEAATDFRFAEYTWPVYILAVAIGLFQLYLHTGRPKGLLIPVSILSSVAVLSLVVIIFRIFLSSVDLGLIIPVILIGVGVVLILGRSRIRSSSY